MGKRRRHRHRRVRSGRTPKGVVALVIVLGLATVGIASFALIRSDSWAVPLDEQRAQSEQIIAEQAARAQAQEQARIDAENAAKAQIVFPSDRPLEAVFIGDSITSGSYASASEYQWENQVAALLATHGPVETTVIASGGQTAEQALTKSIPPAEVTFVLLGNNERFKDAGIESYTANYRALLDRVRAGSPTGAIVCLSPWFAESYGADFFRVVKDSCAAVGGRYVDIGVTMIDVNRTRLGDPTRIGPAPDDGHPNDAGHTAIAAKVAEALFFPAG